ncbi:MAG: FtsW/RodA/SpoVE family cell cycle protein, partial [Candidatus Binatia bacterium]
MARRGYIDWFMFAIAAGLAIFGAIMVYSASAMISLKETQEQSQFAYFYKQLGFTLAGLVVMYAASRVDYHIFQNRYVVFGVLALAALLLLAVFGFPAINGARRWIRFGGFSVQPSELTKVVLPIFLAWFLTKNEDTVGELRSTVLPCLAVLVVLSGLVFIEPDLGTTIVLCAIFSAVYFAGGARIIHIATVAAAMALV